MVMKEAWEKWVQKEIYGGYVKPGYIFPTEGTHYQAFKAGWEAAKHLLPTKIFWPNLGEVLNAAGFYKREPLTDAQVNKLIGEFIDFNSCAGDDREMSLARAIERAHGIKSDE
jgi:hypothetical protein